MPLKNDDCRCFDNMCKHNNECLRYIERNTGDDYTPKVASGYPYDEPLENGCPILWKHELRPRMTKVANRILFLLLLFLFTSDVSAMHYINGHSYSGNLIFTTDDFGNTIQHTCTENIRSGIGLICVPVSSDGSFSFLLQNWQDAVYYVYADGVKVGSFTSTASDKGTVYFIRIIRYSGVFPAIVYSNSPLADATFNLRRAAGF